jgi:hypothetical protein
VPLRQTPTTSRFGFCQLLSHAHREIVARLPTPRDRLDSSDARQGFQNTSTMPFSSTGYNQDRGRNNNCSCGDSDCRFPERRARMASLAPRSDDTSGHRQISIVQQWQRWWRRNGMGHDTQCRVTQNVSTFSGQNTCVQVPLRILEMGITVAFLQQGSRDKEPDNSASVTVILMGRLEAVYHIDRID